MVLSDIVFTEPSWLVSTLPAGSLGTPDDILTNKCMVSEIQPPAAGTYPTEGDVDLGIDYGPTGTEYTGTLVQPVESDVKIGIDYGADGTEFTGTYDPATGGYPPPVPAVRFGGGLS
jgi:hypothetical protein